jgi:hypothetical protein
LDRYPITHAAGIVVDSPDPDAPHDHARLFKITGCNAIHVAGAGALAEEIRTLLRDGHIKGWRLHPVPESRTELKDVVDELKRAGGSNRFYNLLDKAGFATFEEAAATPPEALRAIRNGGERFVEVIRVVAERLYGQTAATSCAVDSTRIEHIENRLDEVHVLRNRELVHLLARSQLPLDVVDVVCASIAGEPVPPADTTVMLLLSAARDETLAEAYRRTHRPADETHNGRT